MATHLEYLEDFDVTACDAHVVAVTQTEGGRLDLELDTTCFYPRGGGQDWDEGIVKKLDGSVIFAVQEVRIDENGVVHHIGAFGHGALQPGDAVTCMVASERRAINTRLHSAGHLIDMAINALGLGWTPLKGQHYPHMSAVEYTGGWQPEKAEELRAAIEQKANELIAAGTENMIRFMPVDKMHTVCRHVPDNIPKNKPARVVMYGEHFGVPCGGTHVRNLREIGIVHVPKLSEKKGTIRVNYTVEGIN